jgi:two-component system phosphate regulon sensor histidine kinase PhoR
MTQEFEDAQVVADEDKLDQVLTNLVNNAVKYAPSGGEIRVVGETIDDGIRISVSDQGIGIPPDQLDKIFERFHKIETEGAGSEGAGIGLYIVRHLVELHGGKIEVESKFGEGSTFTMELPLAPPTSEPLGGSAAKARAS